MLAGNDHVQADEQTVDLIAARVTAALRDDLEAMLVGFARPATGGQSLTVEQLATRLGVARSTVYAHWREWGGYKLGSSPKAAIRFNPSKLPAPRDHAAGHSPTYEQPSPKRSTRRRTRRGLIEDAPRLIQGEELLDGRA